MNKAVQYLKGVGPVRARQLARLGLVTCRDLVRHFPREYSRRRPAAISRLPGLAGETVIISGRLTDTPKEYRRRVHILSATVADSSGWVRCTWFNQAYLRDKLGRGQGISVAGKYSPEYGGNIVVEEYSLTGPLAEIQPVYSLTEGITQQGLAKIIGQALAEYEEPELFPPEFREKYGLLPAHRALAALHFPSSSDELEKALYTGKFTELFLYQLSFMFWRRQRIEPQGFVLKPVPGLLANLEELFAFRFSQDQVKAVDEIQGDLARGRPMSRLLQGDVGSGKTAVAAHALLTCALNGGKGVFMAPTEIVAQQHYGTLQTPARALGVNLLLLTGSSKKTERAQVQAALLNPGGLVLVGTHAVFQEGLIMEELALVVTDEQHRFGVGQRLALSEKGGNPHVLAMSATPIPRTLAMTLYGDLDISTIRQKPLGRKEVVTKIVPASQRQKVFDFIRREIGKGNSGYIICPLIDDSEEVQALSLAAYEKILARGLPGYKYGVLHGRLTGAEKDGILAAMQGGELHFLLATTVVEVGVDSGNATFIVIENSERYGLAQLHQLRGRVGRRREQGYCFLMTEGPGSERVQILEKTTDGFALAVADLKLRGSGQFLGQRQHGLGDFTLVDLVRDSRIASISRRAAAETLPYLTRDPAWRQAAAQVEVKIANLKS